MLYVEQEELPRIIFDQNTKCIVNNGVLISLGGKKGANEEKRDNYVRTTVNLIQHLLPPHKENDAF